MNTPIHEQLRSSREALGYSVEDVAHETRIPASRIKLIEEGKFAAIGSMAYARNFLLTYSRFLGVDARDTLDTLPKPIFAATESYGYLREPVCAWVADDKKSLSAFSAPTTTRKRKPVTSPLAKAVALVFFIGILAAWWGHQVVTAKTSSVVTQAEAVTKPVQMSATLPSSTRTSGNLPSPAANIPWAEVKRDVVRRGNVVDDEEIEVKKASVASASQEGL